MYRHALLVCAFAASLSAAAAEPVCPGTAMQMLVPFPAGTSIDAVTRVTAKRMGEALGEPITIINQPGAEGEIAAHKLVSSLPNGCTFGMLNSGPVAMTPGAKKAKGEESPIDPMRDFSFVGSAFEFSFVLVISPSLTIRTFEDFKAYVRAHPGELNVASSTTIGRAVLELLRTQYGLATVTVAYKGDPQMLPDLVEGRIQGALTTVGFIRSQVAAGKAQPIAVYAKGRNPLIQSTPTFTELGVTELDSARMTVGVFGPAGVAASSISRVHAALAQALADPEVAKSLATQGVQAEPSTPAELKASVAKQLSTWERLVRAKAVHL